MFVFLYVFISYIYYICYILYVYSIPVEHHPEVNKSDTKYRALGSPSEQFKNRLTNAEGNMAWRKAEGCNFGQIEHNFIALPIIAVFVDILEKCLVINFKSPLVNINSLTLKQPLEYSERPIELKVGKYIILMNVSGSKHHLTQNYGRHFEIVFWEQRPWLGIAIHTQLGGTKHWFLFYGTFVRMKWRGTFFRSVRVAGGRGCRWSRGKVAFRRVTCDHCDLTCNVMQRHMWLFF